MTDQSVTTRCSKKLVVDDNSNDSFAVSVGRNSNLKRKSRYKRKLPEEKKKRGPKSKEKVPQTCYECNKMFKCAAQLQIHARIHSGDRPFICSYCPRRFTQKYNLQIHLRSHTGFRPYQCEICSKQFTTLGNFQAHQKIHTGIRDQVCPVCSKAFHSPGDLSKHMITHTGLKSHHCEICGKSFSRNRDMILHKKKIHLNNNTSAANDIFKCPECHKNFTTSSSLSSHFRLHADIISNQTINAHNQIVANLTTTAVGSSNISGIAHLPPPPMGMLSHTQTMLMHTHTQRLHPY